MSQCYHCLKSPHDVDCPAGGTYAKRDSSLTAMYDRGFDALKTSLRAAGKSAAMREWFTDPMPPQLHSPIAFDIMKEHLEAGIEKLITKRRSDDEKYYDATCLQAKDGIHRALDWCWGHGHRPKTVEYSNLQGVLQCDELITLARRHDICFEAVMGLDPSVVRILASGTGKHILTIVNLGK